MPRKKDEDAAAAERLSVASLGSEFSSKEYRFSLSGNRVLFHVLAMWELNENVPRRLANETRPRNLLRVWRLPCRGGTDDSYNCGNTICVTDLLLLKGLVEMIVPGCGPQQLWHCLPCENSGTLSVSQGSSYMLSEEEHSSPCRQWRPSSWQEYGIPAQGHVIKFLFDLAAIFLPVAVAKEYPCSHSWSTAARIFDAVEGTGRSRLHLCLCCSDA